MRIVYAHCQHRSKWGAANKSFKPTCYTRCLTPTLGPVSAAKILNRFGSFCGGFAFGQASQFQLSLPCSASVPRAVNVFSSNQGSGRAGRLRQASAGVFGSTLAFGSVQKLGPLLSHSSSGFGLWPTPYLSNFVGIKARASGSVQSPAPNQSFKGTPNRCAVGRPLIPTLGPVRCHCPLRLHHLQLHTFLLRFGCKASVQIARASFQITFLSLLLGASLARSGVANCVNGRRPASFPEKPCAVSQSGFGFRFAVRQ